MTAMSQKDRLMLSFMDRLYEEICRLEKEERMQASHHDLRLPIEVHHDAIRAWQADDNDSRGRLSVQWVSWDVNAIKKRMDWLRSGPHIFWQQHDANYSQSAQDARNLKRQLLRHPTSINVDVDTMLRDVHDFAEAMQHGRDFQQLQAELTYRGAEKQIKQRSGSMRWKKLSAPEFWNGLDFTLQHFPAPAPRDASLLLATPDADMSLPNSTSSQALTPHSPDAVKGLTGIWLQTLHPIRLRQSFGGGDGIFSPHGHVSEFRWQRMRRHAVRMAEAYERYLVMFTAALAEKVEIHYNELRDDLDELVTDAATLIKLVEELKAGTGDVPIHRLEKLIRELDNEELKAQLLQLLEDEKIDTSSGGLVDGANQVMNDADMQIEALEEQHFKFATTQLSMFEQHKQTIKDLAGQGVNLAGKFVAAAASAAAGRGKDTQGR